MKPKTSSAESTAAAQDPIANGLLKSYRQELLRADAAANSAMFCGSKSERRRALKATNDHTDRAQILLRQVNI